MGAAAGALAGILTVASTGEVGRSLMEKVSEKEEGSEPEIGPVEDLMREHGGLRRILLIYGELMHRVSVNEDDHLQALTESSRIVRSFVEDYHEKLEEDFVFPRFRNKGKLADLSEVLYRQHRAGRRLTDTILRLATPDALGNVDNRRRLSDTMGSFIRMYRPHAAREDTVLFPAFHRITAGASYEELGERFEQKEKELFGEKGFETIIGRIEAIEKTLGIYDLSQFTPQGET